MTTLKEVAALVATLWPTPPWPAAAQLLWSESLSDLDPKALAVAVRQFYATDSHGFRPTPGQIRAIAQPADASAGERAWASVQKAVAHYSSKPAHEAPDMPKFGNPKIAPTLGKIGGFRQFLGGIDAKEVGYARARFLKAYEAACVAQPDLIDNSPRRLTGGEA